MPWESTNKLSKNKKLLILEEEITLNYDFEKQIDKLIKKLVKQQGIEKHRTKVSSDIVTVSNNLKETEFDSEIFKSFFNFFFHWKEIEENSKFINKLLILKIKSNFDYKEYELKVIINLQNLYLKGFINNNNEYYYFEPKSDNQKKAEKINDIEKIQIKNYLKINDEKIIKLPYSGDYEKLDTNNSDILITKQSLKGTIKKLGNHKKINNFSIKQDLIEIIFLTSEALRFNSIKNQCQQLFNDEVKSLNWKEIHKKTLKKWNYETKQAYEQKKKGIKSLVLSFNNLQDYKQKKEINDEIIIKEAFILNLKFLFLTLKDEDFSMLSIYNMFSALFLGYNLFSKTLFSYKFEKNEIQKFLDENKIFDEKEIDFNKILEWKILIDKNSLNSDDNKIISISPSIWNQINEINDNLSSEKKINYEELFNMFKFSIEEEINNFIYFFDLDKIDSLKNEMENLKMKCDNKNLNFIDELLNKRKKIKKQLNEKIEFFQKYDNKEYWKECYTFENFLEEKRAEEINNILSNKDKDLNEQIIFDISEIYKNIKKEIKNIKENKNNIDKKDAKEIIIQQFKTEIKYILNKKQEYEEKTNKVRKELKHSEWLKIILFNEWSKHVKLNHLERVQKWLENNEQKDITLLNDLLFLSVDKNLEEMTRLLLENGVDVNAQDKNGYTPLDYASKNNSSNNIINLLISFGGIEFMKFKFHKLPKNFFKKWNDEINKNNFDIIKVQIISCDKKNKKIQKINQYYDKSNVYNLWKDYKNEYWEFILKEELINQIYQKFDLYTDSFKIEELNDEQDQDAVSDFFQATNTFIQTTNKKFDVPGDGNCLFWAVANAYLLPVRDNNDEFKKRFIKLFDKEDNLIDMQILYKNYDLEKGNDNQIYKNENSKKLITNVFRNRVVNYIENSRGRFEEDVKTEGHNFEEYLKNMKKENTWGGGIEIQAMSYVLDSQILVGDTKIRDDNENLQNLVKIFHVSADEGNVKNHYNFGLEKNNHNFDSSIRNTVNQQEQLLSTRVDKTSSPQI